MFGTPKCFWFVLRCTGIGSARATRNVATRAKETKRNESGRGVKMRMWTTDEAYASVVVRIVLPMGAMC